MLLITGFNNGEIIMIFIVGFVVFILSFLMLITSSLTDGDILLQAVRSTVLAAFSMLLYRITKHI
jgi:hypothetical protein